MIKSIKFILLLMLSVSLFSCEFSSDINSTTPADFVYPLEIGNTWEYERVFESFNFRPDSLRDIFPYDKIVTSSTVEVKKDTTLLDTLKCTVMQETLFELGEILETWNYYENKPDGLYEYAYKSPGAGLTLPKQRDNIRYHMAGMTFKGMREASDYFAKFLPSYSSIADTLIYWDKPNKILAYPPEIGEEWIALEGNPFILHKQIVGEELVSTDAGNFRCYKIHWIYKNSHFDNILFFDYICEKGLIKRSITYTDMRVSTAESPEGIGYMDTIDESILTDINF